MAAISQGSHRSAEYLLFALLLQTCEANWRYALVDAVVRGDFLRFVARRVLDVRAALAE